jgi:MFS family permease
MTMTADGNSAASTLKTHKLWSGPFILFLFIGALSGTATQMVTPLMATYLKDMGISFTLVGTVVSILSFTALIGRPFSGAANDFLNRKVIMFVSSLTVGLCVLGYSFAHSLGLVVAIRVLHGLAFCFQGTASMAFAASFIPRDRFGEGMGYMGMAQIVAFSIGPSVGVTISDTYGTNVCFALAAIISITASFVVLAVPYKFVKRQMPDGYRFKIKFGDLFAKELFLLSAFIGIFSIGNGIINAFLKLLAEERQILNVGLYFTANAFTMVAVRPFVGKLLDRKGLTIIMIPAYIIASAAMFFIAGANATWMLVAAGILKAVGQGSGAPSIQAESVKMLGKERSGVASSTCYIGQDIGNIIGPIAGGWVYSVSSYAVVFNGYAALLLLTGGVFAYYSYVRFKKAKAAAAIQPAANMED